MTLSTSFPLSQAPEGARLRILAFTQETFWHNRLSDLGIHPGSVVEVMKATGPNLPMVVKRGAGRIMVDAVLKHDILVEAWSDK